MQACARAIKELSGKRLRRGPYMGLQKPSCRFARPEQIHSSSKDLKQYSFSFVLEPAS